MLIFRRRRLSLGLLAIFFIFLSLVLVFSFGARGTRFVNVGCLSEVGGTINFDGARLELLWAWTNITLYDIVPPVVIDLDNDGNLEIVLVVGTKSTSEMPDHLYILSPDGKALSYFEIPQRGMYFVTYPFGFADVDEDGVLEVGLVYDGYVRVFDVNGSLLKSFSLGESYAFFDANYPSFFFVGSWNKSFLALYRLSDFGMVWNLSGYFWRNAYLVQADSDAGLECIVVKATDFESSTGLPIFGRIGLVDDNGSFLWERDVLFYYSYFVSFFDVNDDGVLEVLVLSSTGFYVFDLCSGDVLWSFGFDGRFYGSYEAFGIGDVDGDGKVEVVFSGVWSRESEHKEEYRALFILELFKGFDRVIINNEFKAPWLAMQGFSLADVDGDGVSEIIFNTDFNYFIYDFHDDVVYRFDFITEYNSEYFPPYVFDFDGDGLLELLAFRDHAVAFAKFLDSSNKVDWISYGFYYVF